ncbi:MAG: hypothetical protein IJQ32_06355 [Paludibacteraceae bacterium]|nr:hypothetical protein [Paludibacteraceae bacterium]
MHILIFSLVALIILLVIVIVLVRINSKQQLAYQREQVRRLREHADEFMPPRLKALDDWKVELHTALRLAQKNRPKHRGEERDQYDRQLFNELLYCNRFEQFFRLADKRLDGFATKMRNNYQVSDREMMFVCLSLLALSDEQVALIMEYSEASIPTTRKRIWKKLKISNSSDWNSRLTELVQQD